MTIGDLLSSPEFAQKIVLQKLICNIFGISKEKMWTMTDQKLEENQIKIVKNQYQDYMTNQKPIEYILGKVTFFENDFFVNENTLIPRPETEYMIQAVREFIQNQKSKENLLLDIGTGCGVLGISVLLQNPSFFQKVIFSDISSKALEVAEKNYEKLIFSQKNINIEKKFIESDLLDFLITENLGNSKIILVANLPYIPEQTFDDNAPENVKNREPKMAFVGGNDGLDYYRKMFDQIKKGKILPKNYELFMEMMTWQVDILRKEFGQEMKFEEIKTFHFNIKIVKGNFL